MKFQRRVWHIGMTDKDLEGEFVEDSDKSLVTFQAFALSQPNNKVITFLEYKYITHHFLKGQWRLCGLVFW